MPNYNSGRGREKKQQMIKKDERERVKRERERVKLYLPLLSAHREIDDTDYCNFLVNAFIRLSYSNKGHKQST